MTGRVYKRLCSKCKTNIYHRRGKKCYITNQDQINGDIEIPSISSGASADVQRIRKKCASMDFRVWPKMFISYMDNNETPHVINGSSLNETLPSSCWTPYLEAREQIHLVASPLFVLPILMIDNPVKFYKAEYVIFLIEQTCSEAKTKRGRKIRNTNNIRLKIIVFLLIDKSLTNVYQVCPKA